MAYSSEYIDFTLQINTLREFFSDKEEGPSYPDTMMTLRAVQALSILGLDSATEALGSLKKAIREEIESKILQWNDTHDQKADTVFLGAYDLQATGHIRGARIITGVGPVTVQEGGLRFGSCTVACSEPVQEAKSPTDWRMPMQDAARRSLRSKRTK